MALTLARECAAAVNLPTARNCLGIRRVCDARVVRRVIAGTIAPAIANGALDKRPRDNVVAFKCGP